MTEMENEEAGIALVGEGLNQLRELRSAFVRAQDSNAGDYRAIAADHLTQLLDGYLVLRRNQQFRASRVLIRPAIESVASLLCASADPVLLVRRLCRQIGWEKKAVETLIRLRPEGEVMLREVIADLDAEKTDILTAFRNTYRTMQFVEDSVQDTEVVGKLGLDLVLQHKEYGGFVHGSLPAMDGRLEGKLGPLDNQVAGMLAAMAAFAIAKLLPDCNFDPVPYMHRLQAILPLQKSPTK